MARPYPKFVYEDVDRHGNVRIYFWRGKGHCKVRLHEQPGTVEFLQRYNELVAGKMPPAPPTDSHLPKPGTFRWLCSRYFDSAEYAQLEGSTQTVRRRILEAMCEEPIAPDRPEKFADFPLHRLTTPALAVLRDRKKGLPEAANGRVKALRVLFAWASSAEQKLMAANPARDLARRKTSSKGHHTWTPAEVEQFERTHSPGTKPHLALMLLLYTGARRSDVVQFGPQHVQHGKLSFTPYKTRKHGVRVEIPVLAPLQRAIDAAPGRGMTFLVTSYDRPFTAAGFGNWFRERCNEAGLRHCTAHGLRKAGATLAAENGATVHQLMAIFGWLDVKEAERYTREADRKKLGAAAHLLERPKK